MEYTYTIERLSTKNRFMRVLYESDGHAPIRKAFNPTDFTESALKALIEALVPSVIAEWEAQAAQPDEDEESLGVALTGSAEYIAPVPPEPTQEQLETEAIEAAAAARYKQEESGITWSDGTSMFYLDTTADSQNRFTAARTAIEGGQRADGSVWKLADVTSGVPVLTFRPTTNAELIVWAGLVHDHVQKCFQAEANAVQKILGGDLTATFDAEYALLN